jgi:Zn-dependent peptidase ImmA (M78 family)
MHEFEHIILRDTVIDMPEDSLFGNNIKNEIEEWCNEFASEFLLPEEIAIEIFNRYKSNITNLENIEKISKKWKVSKKFLLYKMYKLGYIGRKDFEHLMPVDKKTKTGKKGSPPPDIRCISERGKKFIILVRNNVNNNFITLREALDYLSIKVHHYQKVIKKIEGR